VEGISLEELQLAARNHGMPLEALRYPVTPVGLHYLLIHYDVPAVDADAWRLTIHGERELELSLDELRARPAAEHTVTMECAGNGRARLEPRPVSQPWLLEAVGTARWRGTPLAAAAGGRGRSGRHGRGALHRARPRRRGRGGAGLPAALQLDDALRGEVLLAYEMNGAPLAAAARLPAPPGRPRLVRDDEREVALADRAPSTRRSPATSSRGRTGCARPRTRRASRSTGCSPAR
jgi:DMSO/TMAO reductase YedYZ molybdopterin-dependent catalytic subunit